MLVLASKQQVSLTNNNNNNRKIFYDYDYKRFSE